MRVTINKISRRFFANNLVMFTVLSFINKCTDYINKHWGWFFTNGNKEPYKELYPWRKEWSIEK